MPLIQGESGAGTNSAVYLALRNDGEVGDRLLGGETPTAAAVEVHESYLVDDVLRMRKVDSLEVPPTTTIELKPGGLHLMLLGITRSLVEGEEVELTLKFERSGPLVLRVSVRGPGGR
jgi:copper(I)-binding protein